KTGTFDKVALGVKIVDLAVFEASTGTDLEAESGVYIAEVMADTVAQKYGIQVGDVIVKIGETEINTMSDLNKALYQYSTGQKATVTVNRGGKEVAIEVTF
ncbi:MAG: PDZ domain-containing protein, partial [Peptostreptococcaceae bacterium]